MNFCETKKELARNTREMARLRKAIDTAGNCPHRDDCPVLDRLRESSKEHEPGSPDGIGKHRQRERKPTGGTGDGGYTGEFGEAVYTCGQPP